jgi:hypothetical protein
VGKFLKGLGNEIAICFRLKKAEEKIEKKNILQDLFQKITFKKDDYNPSMLQSWRDSISNKVAKNITQNRPLIKSFINIFANRRTNNTAQKIKKQYSIFTRKPRKQSQPVFILPVSWGGLAVTEKEKISLKSLHERRLAVAIDSLVDKTSPWLHKASSTDLLRFLRVKNGDEDEGFKMILAHAKWRTTKYGADTILKSHTYDKSELNRELFWLGVSANGHPTLVIRTQAHDGSDYNEDPKIFTSFMVSKIEEGIQKYGVGSTRQVCVILDRGNYIKKGIKKEYKTDMGVIPNLVKLFQHLHFTLMENYPDLLLTAQVVPASWFFSMCYKITSRVMDAKSREKFLMINAENVPGVMTAMFSAEKLPPHLGGTSTTYGEIIEESKGINNGVQNKRRPFWNRGGK